MFLWFDKVIGGAGFLCLPFLFQICLPKGKVAERLSQMAQDPYLPQTLAVGYEEWGILQIGTCAPGWVLPNHLDLV